MSAYASFQSQPQVQALKMNESSLKKVGSRNSSMKREYDIQKLPNFEDMDISTDFSPSSVKNEEEKKIEDKPVPEVVRSIIIQQKFGGNWTLDALVWKQ